MNGFTCSAITPLGKARARAHSRSGIAWRNSLSELAQDFLMNGVRRVEWTAVYDTLRGEQQSLEDADELTTLAHRLLAGTDWQTIVKDAQYLTQADDMLMGWLEDQCLTWIESPEARQYTGSVGQFANTVLHLYFDAVKWEEVASALRGE